MNLKGKWLGNNSHIIFENIPNLDESYSIHYFKNNVEQFNGTIHLALNRHEKDGCLNYGMPKVEVNISNFGGFGNIYVWPDKMELEIVTYNHPTRQNVLFQESFKLSLDY